VDVIDVVQTLWLEEEGGEFLFARCLSSNLSAFTKAMKDIIRWVFSSSHIPDGYVLQYQYSHQYYIPRAAPIHISSQPSFTGKISPKGKLKIKN
jgi:hypothetical protein